MSALLVEIVPSTEAAMRALVRAIETPEQYFGVYRKLDEPEVEDDLEQLRRGHTRSIDDLR